MSRMEFVTPDFPHNTDELYERFIVLCAALKLAGYRWLMVKMNEDDFLSTIHGYPRLTSMLAYNGLPIMYKTNNPMSEIAEQLALAEMCIEESNEVNSCAIITDFGLGMAHFSLIEMPEEFARTKVRNAFDFIGKPTDRKELRPHD